MTSPRVLIVDDEPEIRHALRLLFEYEAFTVVAEADNGIDAISLAIRHQPHLIVMDHRMARLSGEKSAQVIRALVPEARIVAFSAYLEAEPEWADAFLNKERISDIAPLVTRLMSAQPAGDSLQAN